MTDTDSNDNIFAIPRPFIAQHSSSPSSVSVGTMKKQLPSLPKVESRPYAEPTSPPLNSGRVRAMTSSSYASTAKPPTLDADMNFGSSSFDDLFSGLDAKEAETASETPGRSLLAGKRTFQAEPIQISRQFEVEAPLKSWDSRGSADNLMSSPRSPDNDSPPPPVPPHKYGQYAPVASHSPDLNGGTEFLDNDAPIVRQSVMSHKSTHESSPEQHPTSISSSSAPSLQTPLSSRPASHKATPKPTLRTTPEDGDEDIFATPKQNETKKATPVPKPAVSAPKENNQPRPTTGGSAQRVMTQAEFQAMQKSRMVQPQDDSSDGEEYEDEEDAEEKAQQEQLARRKRQQMDLARETMRRTTTAPANGNRPDSVADAFSMGFPSETSMKADEWEDEDIPLGILAAHGFPNKAGNKAPVQPANAMPSYFRSSTPTLNERPASAGAVDNRASQMFRPPFARNLPDDPHSSFIGGGLVRPTNRESMGFSRGPASVAGDVPQMPMVYPEPQLSAPSLVEQIHMRDMNKQKYMGGASSKKPQGGPFTGLLAAQMNGPTQTGPQTRMSTINGMPPAMGMGMGMNMNLMGAPMGMPMVGMNQMAYPMQQNDLMQMQQFQQMQQMQQLLAAQQMQLQQMQMQQGQDPRMSMAFPNNMQDPRMSMAFVPNQMLPPQDPRMSMASSSFLSVPPAGQRPMSTIQGAQPPQRPFSTPGQLSSVLPPPPVPMNGYAPSVAPSERSVVGQSSRYRAVNMQQDGASSSSVTLQASGGANQTPQTIKGILKKKTPQPQEEDEEGWGKMAQRKSKFVGNGFKSDDSALRDLVRGVDAL